jgi:polyhydroxyalkanoate synthesis regulator phasin
VTAGITELVIRQEENDAGITVGSAGNTYIVSGNFLVYGKGADELRQIANNMLSKIKGLEYRPFTADVKGNPCFEVGDAIRFVTTYEFVESYILKRTLKGLQALRDDWSADGVETYTDDTNSVTSQIEQLKGKSNTLERTSEETISELKNLEESTTSRFTQTANSIAAEIERAEGAESTLSGKIETNADAITAEVKRSTGAESDIIATLELKIDKNDDGTIISLINGSADRINFNANNMFTVTAPNLVITADGHLYMTDGTFTGSITGGSITGTTFEQTASGGGVKIKDGQIQSYCNDTNAEAATANIILYNNNSAFSGNERCQISAKAIHFYDADGNSKGKFSINGMVFPDGSVQTKAATTPDLTGYALIDTVTPTSNSTSDTKSPSYSAVAKMIKNIEADIPTVPAAGINVYSSGEGTLTTSGSANYFLCTQTFGQLTSIGAKQLKISGSSKRWKHDIGDISNEELNPHRLYDARIVQFKYNLDYLSSADMRYNMDLPGFIAEELLEIYPVGVDIDEEGLPCDWNARFIIPPMLYLIQEQHGQIEKLEAQVQELINKTENQSREMESLKERIAALEKAMA